MIRMKVQAPTLLRGVPWIKADWSRIARMRLLDWLLESVEVLERHRNGQEAQRLAEMYRSFAEQRRRYGRALDAYLESEDAIQKKAAADVERELPAVSDIVHATRCGFAAEFPEVAEEISDEDLAVAANYMARRNPGRTTTKEPAKWSWFAEWMVRVGIGVGRGGVPINAELLKNDWMKWRKATKGRYIVLDNA